MNAALGFIGGGNMARALIAGLVAGGEAPAGILVAEPDAAKRDALREEFGVGVHPEAGAVAARVDTLVLAVKPQVLPTLARELAKVLPKPAPLVISIAAGVRGGDIATWLGGDVPVVRCMPNTPALVRQGITALYAGATVSAAMRARANEVLAAVGETVWVEREADLDAVTALSGSGPAYFFLMIEALEQAGAALGLDPAISRRLAVRTALGSATLAAQPGADPGVLRVQVTSPGGTTERALTVLEDGGLRPLFARALDAASARATELADAASRAGALA